MYETHNHRKIASVLCCVLILRLLFSSLFHHGGFAFILIFLTFEQDLIKDVERILVMIEIGEAFHCEWVEFVPIG